MNTILKILLTILLTTIIAIVIVILYFFIFDIETKIPKEIEQECKIEEKQFMGRKIFILKDRNIKSNEKYILYFHGGSYVAEATQNHFKFLEKIAKQFMGRKIFILKDRNIKSNEKYILYFHGGSYVAEATQNHFKFLEKIAKDTKYTIIMPDYPLTPKYTYDDVFDMVVPLYKEIISKIDNNDLILMGDSAGGGLALALYEKISTDFIDIPSKTILISPWLDVRMQNENINEVSKNDDILSKEKLILAGRAYAGKDGMDKYLVNPIMGDLSKLNNISIFTGTYDILNPDALLLKEKADKVGGDVKLKVYDKAKHIDLSKLNNISIFTGTYDILNPDALLLKEKADKVGGDVKLKVYDKAKHIWLIDNNSDAEITTKAYNDLLEELRNEGE